MTAVRCAHAHLTPESTPDQLQSVLDFPCDGFSLEVGLELIGYCVYKLLTPNKKFKIV